LDSARQPEPPTLVLDQLSCYHFRVLDPRLPLRCSNRLRLSIDLSSRGRQVIEALIPVGSGSPPRRIRNVNRPIGSVTSNCSLHGGSVEIGRDLLTADRDDSVAFA